MKVCAKKKIQITLHSLVIPFLPPSLSLASLLHCVLYDDVDGMTQECIFGWCNATTTDAALLYLRKIVVAWYRMDRVSFRRKEIRRRWEKFFSSTSTILNFDKMSLLSSPFFKLDVDCSLCSFEIFHSFLW